MKPGQDCFQGLISCLLMCLNVFLLYSCLACYACMFLSFGSLSSYFRMCQQKLKGQMLTKLPPLSEA